MWMQSNSRRRFVSILLGFFGLAPACYLLGCDDLSVVAYRFSRDVEKGRAFDLKMVEAIAINKDDVTKDKGIIIGDEVNNWQAIHLKRSGKKGDLLTVFLFMPEED